MTKGSAAQNVKSVGQLLCDAAKSLEAAKERLYDAYNLITDGQGGWPDESTFPEIGKRDFSKLDRIAHQCWTWGSELAEMSERLDRR